MKDYFKSLVVGLATVVVVLLLFALTNWLVTDPIGGLVARTGLYLVFTVWLVFLGLPILGGMVQDAYRWIRKELSD